MNRTVIALALCVCLLLLAAGGFLFVSANWAPGPSAIGRSQQPLDDNSNSSAKTQSDTKTPPNGHANAPDDTVPKAKPEIKQPQPESAGSGKSRNVDKIDLQKAADEVNGRNPAIVEQPVQPRKMLTIIISGNVTDERGAGVGGADIVLEFSVMKRQRGTLTAAASVPEKAATSDASGSFTLRLDREVEADATVKIYLWAKAASFAESDSLTLDVSSGGAYPEIALKLKSAGGVTGHVVDTNGNAVSGVKIVIGSAAMPGERTPSSGMYRHVVTDATGGFVIADMAAGSYPIGVLSVAHDYKSGPRFINVSGGEVAKLESDIVVEVLISLKLRLVDAAGANVTGEVVIEFRDGDKMVQRLSARISEDGSVVLAYPPVGGYAVLIHAEGYIDPPLANHVFTVQQMTDMGTFTLTADPNAKR